MELAMRRQSFLPLFMIERRPGDLAGDPGDPTGRNSARLSQVGSAPRPINTGNSPRDHSHHDAGSGDGDSNNVPARCYRRCRRPQADAVQSLACAIPQTANGRRPRAAGPAPEFYSSYYLPFGYDYGCAWQRAWDGCWFRTSPCS